MSRGHCAALASGAILTLQFMFALDSQVMTVALPSIQDAHQAVRRLLTSGRAVSRIL